MEEMSNDSKFNQIIDLYKEKKFTAKEIAEKVGVKTNIVYSYLSKAARLGIIGQNDIERNKITGFKIRLAVEQRTEEVAKEQIQMFMTTVKDATVDDLKKIEVIILQEVLKRNKPIITEGQFENMVQRYIILEEYEMAESLLSRHSVFFPRNYEQNITTDGR